MFIFSELSPICLFDVNEIVSWALANILSEEALNTKRFEFDIP